MRFVVPIQEFDFYGQERPQNDLFRLDSNTSVNHLKAHFFETLEKIGVIIKISPDKNIDELNKLCSEADVIFATFHNSPPQGLACRLLQHTKGALMLTGGFLDKWTFGKSTMNIVTSEQQALQLEKGLINSAPLLGVFTPKIDADTFCLPSAEEKAQARKEYGVSGNDFHIVYAGRVISNKGICQLIRATNLLDEKNIHISIVGDFEPDFEIYHNGANHTTFCLFFEREITAKSKHKLTRFTALQPRELKKLFWSVDCFVYPSFHEDENFGITPREAILCGTPVVVTDFCGLGALKQTYSGLLTTYPTLGGVRFSVNELAKEIQKIKNWTVDEKEKNTQFNAEWVKKECCAERSEQSLWKAINKLLQLEPYQPIGGWRSNDRLKTWLLNAPEKFRKASNATKHPILEGLYTDGTGDSSAEFSDAHFLMEIQSLYTTKSEVPAIEIGKSYRGFWRVNLWEEECTFIEFGFPGLRMKKYKKQDWKYLYESSIKMKNEAMFTPANEKSGSLLQELILLGYVVPNDIND